MEYRFLGKSGLQVSALSYGNMVNYKPEDDEINCAIIQKCLEAGVNFFDTAEVYASGLAEEALGRALKKLNVQREKVVISTKLISNYRPGLYVNRSNTLSRKHLLEGIDASLKRLQLDYVDIVFAHRQDDNTSMEEICRGFNQIIEDGKAFYWGTSKWDACAIIEAHNVCDRLNLVHPVAEQCQYNMIVRQQFEADYVPLYEQFSMGTTVWGPLAGGLLTGKYNEGVPPESRASLGIEYFPPTINGVLSAKAQDKYLIQQLKALADIAKQVGCSQTQLSLAWCLHNKDVSTAIIGAKTVAQVVDSLEAVKIKLSPEILAQIEVILGNRPNPSFNWRKFKQNDNRRQ